MGGQAGWGCRSLRSRNTFQRETLKCVCGPISQGEQIEAAEEATGGPGPGPGVAFTADSPQTRPPHPSSPQERQLSPEGAHAPLATPGSCPILWVRKLRPSWLGGVSREWSPPSGGSALLPRAQGRGGAPKQRQEGRRSSGQQLGAPAVARPAGADPRTPHPEGSCLPSPPPCGAKCPEHVGGAHSHTRATHFYSHCFLIHLIKF